MQRHTKRIALVCLLIFTTVYLLCYERSISKNTYSTVSFLDVGQGDSILVTSPSGKQLLVDGGRSKNILRLLEEVMPRFDHSLDLIIGTHPDADHIGGLPAVLEEYEVGGVLEPGSVSGSKIYKTLEESIIEKKIPHLLARENMVIDFGDGAYFVVVFPHQDVSTWETNNSSIVGLYIYKNTSFMLTGDAPLATEMYLSKKYGTRLHADVLKLGHHGSRTSSGETFLKLLNPGLAIISAGKDNSYGHPHKEVTDRLKKMMIPSLSTAEMGTLTFHTNGETISFK